MVLAVGEHPLASLAVRRKAGLCLLVSFAKGCHLSGHKFPHHTRPAMYKYLYNIMVALHLDKC